MIRGTIALCAAQDRQSNHLHVFLERGARDHLGRLPKAGVNDLHAGVAERASNYFGAPVVAVQAGLGDKDPDGMIHLF